VPTSKTSVKVRAVPRSGVSGLHGSLSGKRAKVLRLMIRAALPCGMLNLPPRGFRGASWRKLENEDGSAESV